MIVITGRQRSGTTLIAEALIKSGYDLGSQMRDEVGGYEHDFTCAFYRDYLGDVTFPFDDYPGLPSVHSGNFTTFRRKAIKFSYLMMNPVFVTIWHKFRSHRKELDKFLVLHRTSEEVVQSKWRKHERFKHDSLLLDQDAITLKWSFNCSLSLLRQWYLVEIVHFPSDFTDLILLNEALARLDPEVQINPRVWKELYDPSKIHVGGTR